MARQIAHDVRSPLAALSMLLDDPPTNTAEQRAILDTAVRRINDICNSLVVRHGSASQPAPSTAFARGASTAPQVTLCITEVLELLLSEQGMACQAPLPYGLFVAVPREKFTACVLGLLAYVPPNTPEVQLTSAGDQVLLSIQGTAISESATWRDAQSAVGAWGGTLTATPAGIVLALPRAVAPPWFFPELVLCAGSTVVILDDDASIHSLWKQRICHRAPAVEVMHVHTPEALAALQPRLPAHTQYLVDYELADSKQTGLDIVNQLRIAPQSILVSSHAGESAIRERCLQYGMRLLSKSMATRLPVRVIQRVDADVVLLDDDCLVHATWGAIARQRHKRLQVFSDTASLFETLPAINKSTPIYVDLGLANGESGLAVSERLAKLGYEELYITTGHAADSVPHRPWIKRVVDKAPAYQLMGWAQESYL